jgi:hypothetical protein
MDASLMSGLKELEEENRHQKKMYAEEHLKAEIVQDALAINGEAISTQRDGAQSGIWAHSPGLRGTSDQRDLLSPPGDNVR